MALGTEMPSHCSSCRAVTTAIVHSAVRNRSEITSAVFVLRRRISQQWQNLFLVQEGNNNAQLAHFKKDPLQEGITQGNFIHTTRNGIRHTHHFWHSRITIAYGMRIGLASTHAFTFLKTSPAS